MTLRTAIPIAALLVHTSTAVAAPESFVVDRGHSEASFQVRHILSKTRGRFTDFTGRIQLDREKPEASVVEFRIKAASVDTDLEDRDQHLRSADFFDVENHPEIVFRGRAIRRVGKDRYEVTGVLAMRGVEKQVVLPVTFHGVAKDPWGGERAGFSAVVTLNRKDFGMIWNKALDQGGFVLGDEVWVTLEIEAMREKASN